MTFWHFLSLVAIAVLTYAVSPYLLLITAIIKLCKQPEYVQDVLWEEVEHAIENVKVRTRNLRAQSEQESVSETDDEEELLDESDTETMHD